MTPEIKEYLQNVPSSLRPAFQRALESDKSKANAIKMKCYDCMGFQRKEVQECDIVTCPLYQVNPLRVRANKPPRKVRSATDPSRRGTLRANDTQRGLCL